LAGLCNIVSKQGFSITLADNIIGFPNAVNRSTVPQGAFLAFIHRCVMRAQHGGGATIQTIDQINGLARSR